MEEEEAKKKEGGKPSAPFRHSYAACPASRTRLPPPGAAIPSCAVPPLRPSSSLWSSWSVPFPLRRLQVTRDDEPKKRRRQQRRLLRCRCRHRPNLRPHPPPQCWSQQPPRPPLHPHCLSASQCSTTRTSMSRDARQTREMMPFARQVQQATTTTTTRLREEDARKRTMTRKKNADDDDDPRPPLPHHQAQTLPVPAPHHTNTPNPRLPLQPSLVGSTPQH